MPSFDVLICHPDFEEHQIAAGRRVVTFLEAEDAWYERRVIVPNRRGRAAPYLMLGRTPDGREITVVILQTLEVGTWLAYTAWDTKASDR